MDSDPSSRKLLNASLALVVLVGLAFSGSAFRIDDPTFIWPAKHLIDHPLDPYGFKVNWFGVETTMFQATWNPPLVSYYQTLVSVLGGWGERAMHFAFILPAVLCLVASYHLAGLLGVNTGLVALFVAVSPVYLLSSTTVMCDVWMASFWTLACLFWVRGFHRNEWWSLSLGAGFSGLAALSKYFGIACVLLLIAYGVAKRPRQISWWAWLAIPLVMVLSWNELSRAVYGSSHVAYSLWYTGSQMKHVDLTGKTLTALSFLGGCTFFPLVLLFSSRVNMRGLIVPGSALLLFLVAGSVRNEFAGFRGTLSVDHVLLFAAFGAIGTLVLWKSVALLKTDLTPEHLLLALWILGTFIFVAGFNWTVSGRNLLPLVPAVAIVVAKHLGSLPRISPNHFSAMTRWGVVAASAALAVAVTFADHALATSARGAADDITREIAVPGGTIRFQGHWGFQYYMEAQGAVPYDLRKRQQWQQEDILVIPTNNSNITWPDRNSPLVLLRVFRYTPNTRLATMNRGARAGFYTSLWGPLPFSFGRADPEEYHVFGVRRM